MKKIILIIGQVICCLYMVSVVSAQSAFSNCSAAFLDNKMIVDSYSPGGQCVLGQASKGVLTVCTASLSDTENKAVDKLNFKIAIRDQITGTLTMYSDETFKQVSIQTVLKKVSKGDHIVLLTMKDEYSLPHNEILIE